MDMMVDDASSAAISDKIKEILYAKSAEKIDAARPLVGAELFGDEVPEVQSGQECGMAFENYEDIRPNDVIEIFEREEIARKLD